MNCSELAAGNFDPEALSGGHVAAFVDLQCRNQVASRDARGIEEAEEEQDQPRIAVYEDHPVASGGVACSCALAPVGDGASDEDLPGVSSPISAAAAAPFIRPVRLAHLALLRPVLAGSFRRAPRGISSWLSPGRGGKVPDPKGDGTLGYAKSGGDLRCSPVPRRAVRGPCRADRPWRSGGVSSRAAGTPRRKLVKRASLVSPRIALISRRDLPSRRRAIARSRKRSSSSLVLILEF